MSVKWIKKHYRALYLFFQMKLMKFQKKKDTAEDSPAPTTRVSHGVHKEDVDFIADSKEALLTQSTPVAGFILYAILGFLVIGLIWSYFAVIEQATVAEGKVIPVSEAKVIQSLDGGIISEIPVYEGNRVHKGQIILKFDDTRYKADYRQAQEKYFTLIAAIARLNAETQGLSRVDFPKELKEQHADLIFTENKLFLAKKQSLEQEMHELNKNYQLSKHMIEMYEPLLKRGIVPKIDYFRAQQSYNEIKHSMLVLEDKYRQDALTELNQRKGELAMVIESLQVLKDKMQRTILYSPVNGIIKKIYFHTIGAVVQTGQPIMEIVPIEDYLIIQARIRPSEIAFIKEGQSATVKISAYDFSIYGSLTGHVSYISPDTLEENKNSPVLDKDAASYYLVNIRTEKNHLGTDQHPLPILPGMNATVHIKTGQKTILDYILKPLIKARQESLREH